MTYSIIALDRCTRTLGVAVASGSIKVWERVPHVKSGVAAIVTQGYTDISYGVEGLKLIENGYSPDEALKTLLRRDPYREFRQVAIIDVEGNKAVFTGKKTPEYKGHIIGDNYIVVGSMLAGWKVLEKMAEAFENAEHFTLKLANALEAGRKAGSDIRGERSAVIIIVQGRL